ncbi:hypothetical protein [Shewanella donghaensis]|uniref:hypothetical protein n=1 Tax=Shewanella donghaensis TaxID=238836 RepID=UPI001183417E|nr:hypothetical protein [Shewanella donghaensis]
MNFNRLLMKVCFIACMIFSANIYANNYVECYDCSSEEMKSVALTWAKNNISDSEARNNVRKDVHLINILDNNVESYQVHLQLVQVPPPLSSTMLPFGEKIYTPIEVSRLLVDLESARSQLLNAGRNLTVPTSVVSDAWQFTNCAFCENNVDSFLNSSLSGEILTVQLTITAIAKTFGLIETGIPDTFRIELEAGGFLELLITINNEPATLKVVVTKAVDQDNNTVPFSADKLRNLIIQISSVNRASNIDSFLNNFNLAIPHMMGVVTINDCPSIVDEDEIPRPCSK